MNKILFLLILLINSIFASEYMVQIKPYEKFEIKAESSGIIKFVNKNIETKFQKEKILLIKIDSKDEELELKNLKNTYQVQKDIVEIKKQNFKTKKRIRQLSLYDKNLEKLSFLESKKELYQTKQIIDKLNHEIEKKLIYLENRYLDTILVKENEYVNEAEVLFYSYDTSKLKIVLFLSKEELKNIHEKVLYINDKKSNFKIHKIHKIKDNKKISRYEVVFIKDKKDKEKYFFDEVVRVRLK